MSKNPLAGMAAVFAETCAAMADPEHCMHAGVAGAPRDWWQGRRDDARKALADAGFDPYGDRAKASAGFTRSKAFTDARELAERWAMGTPVARSGILQELIELIERDRPAGIMTLLAFVHFVPNQTPVSLVDTLQGYLWPDIG